MLPAFEAIRSCSPPCASTGFLKHADPATLQWRSFRRGGYQAMRRASVPKTVRHYMMRWNAKNERRCSSDPRQEEAATALGLLGTRFVPRGPQGILLTSTNVAVAQ